MGELEIMSAPVDKKDKKFDFKGNEKEEQEIKSNLRNIILKNQKKMR